MRAVEISVTAAHISAGKRCTSTRCPVALAIRETLIPLSADVYVEEDMIHFGLAGGYGSVATPEAAAIFVDEFDDGLPVQPFTFTLLVPDVLVPAALVGAVA